MSGIQVRPIGNGGGSRMFAAVARSVYAGDSNWVAPFPGDEVRVFDPQANPALARRRWARWVVTRRDRLVGRIAAFAPADRPGIGYFGFFESADDRGCAAALLEHAECWLAEVGCRECFGPVPVTPRDQLGLLIEGFEQPPFLFTPYNPPYYSKLLESGGYHPACFLRAYGWELSSGDPRQIRRLAERAALSPRFRVRSLAAARLAEETRIITRLVNETLADAWHYDPISEREADELARLLRPILDPEIALIAEDEQGPCGVALALPDANWLWRRAGGRLWPLGWLRLLRDRRRIPQARVMVLGLAGRARHSGLAGQLIARWFCAAPLRGYRTAELAQVFDHNVQMRRILERMRLPVVRRYSVYTRTLTT